VRYSGVRRASADSVPFGWFEGRQGADVCIKMLDTLAFVGPSLGLGRDEVKEVEDYCFSCYYTCLVVGWLFGLFYRFGAHNMVGRREGNGNGYMH
jgi:hypothetical protein